MQALPSQTRRGFLAAAGAPAFLHGAAAAPPNIVFLMPDQLRAHAVGCYGNREVRTPNIDRLASEGLLFEHAFANTPVCCPARANILTGRYAHRNGMVANDLRLRESEVSVAAVLRDAGYRTGFIGKWHLDGGKRLPGFVPPGPRRQGFEFWAANECSHDHFRNHYFRDNAEPIPVRGFEPEGWTDLGIEFLERTRQDRRPFFLSLQMGPPHDPYKAPEQYRRLYDPARLTMRPNWRAGAGVPGPDDIAEYYGMITAIDDQVGRLMAALDQLGLAGNTIVLFSSDHGDMLGSQGKRLKRKPWEESIHVPAILRYPTGVRQARRERGFFTHVDYAPTLLGMCGVPAPRTMQGTDLSALVLGRKQPAPDSAYFQIFGPYDGDGTTQGWRGVRTSRYMYARYESEPWVLYDLEADPYEMKNLAADSSAAPAREALEKRIGDWMRRTGDSWRFDWRTMVEDKGRLYRYETFYTIEEYLEWAKRHPEVQ